MSHPPFVQSAGEIADHESAAGLAQPPEQLAQADPRAARAVLRGDREVLVGYQRITCEIHVRAQADPMRIQRMVEKAEQYCVVRDTLARGVPVESRVLVENTAST